MAPGANVDLVLTNPYQWKELGSNSFDVVVSGQALEHIEYFWLAMLEINRVLKPGGLCCIIAPSGGPEHRYPVDCWRFYPDGFRAMARYARLEELEVYAQWDSELYPNRDPRWADCVLIARKPGRRAGGLLSRVRRLISQTPT
jgi:SAM-dependent methyltransferase